jgi:O-antigen/teichoic acid export membrane protein
LKLFRILVPQDETSGFILRGSMLSVALRLAGVVLGYLSHVVISRLLGVHGYGIYVIAISYALVLTLPARLGFDQSPLRYATVYLEAGQPGRLRGFIRVAVSTVTLASIVIGVAFVLIGSAAHAAEFAVLVAAGFLVLPQALLGVLSVIVRSSRRVFASQFYDQMLRPALQIILLLSFTLVARRRLQPSDALFITTLATFAALAALVFHFRRIFAPARRSPPDYGATRQWFALSLPLLIITFAQELLNQVEIILLGYLGDARQAALFSAAWRLASLVMLALGTFGIICGPVVASAFHRRDFVELNRVVQFGARLTTVSGALAILLLVIAGKLLLSLFGPGFDAAYPTLLVLLVGGGVNAYTGIVAYLLTMTGRERTAVAIFCFALSLSIGLNLLLIPSFGSLGAAIASSAALSAWNLAMAVYVRRALGIDATALARPPRAGRHPV